MAGPCNEAAKQGVKRKSSFHPELQETLFTWKIENLNLRMAQKDIPVDSPCFSIDPIDSTRMFIRLVPLGDRNEKLSVQLHRAIDNGPTLFTLKYRFHILDDCHEGNPRSLTTARGLRVFRLGTHRLRLNHTDCPRRFVWERLLYDPRRELAITCHILPFNEPLLERTVNEEDDDVLRLSLDLTLLYQEETCSDIVLCAGGEKFNAHRSILSARSPTFAKELEKYIDCGPVELASELCAPVLKALLKYLYSGRLADEIPDLHSEMYCAALKYEVTDLKWKLYAFPKRAFVHTKVNSEVKAVSWTLKEFGDFETMIKVYSPIFCLEYPVSCSFQFMLYVTASTEIPVGNVIIPNVKISVSRVSYESCKVMSLYLKLAVIDAGRRLDICCSDYHLYTNDDDWQFPPFLNTYRLLADRVNYLPNNTLSLFCEFIVSDGTYRSYVQNAAMETFLQYPEDLRSYAMDIRDMYVNKKFSDIILSAVDGKIPAHKAILCARSPILKACIENIESLKVIYLAAPKDIVDKMLLYIYTGEYPKLNKYTTAMKLHVLSNELKVLNVKEYCQEYMMSVLSVRNVMKIVEFAEEHKETELCTWLEDFIHTNKAEIDEATRLELRIQYERRMSRYKKCIIL